MRSWGYRTCDTCPDEVLVGDEVPEDEPVQCAECEVRTLRKENARLRAEVEGLRSGGSS